tara:strand:+ start:184 stop:783 length:600 start_codon:yes stop_codon:yes gene_type:complete
MSESNKVFYQLNYGGSDMGKFGVSAAPSALKKALVIVGCSFLLAACKPPSTDSGVAEIPATEAFAGNYEGMLHLELSAEAIDYEPQSEAGSIPIEIDITEDGIIYLTADDYTAGGLINNDGEWKLEIAINDFIELIDDKVKDDLQRAGCPFDKSFLKIVGNVHVTEPNVRGYVSGKLSCKILLVKIATVKFSGSLTANV